MLFCQNSKHVASVQRTVYTCVCDVMRDIHREREREKKKEKKTHIEYVAAILGYFFPCASRRRPRRRLLAQLLEYKISTLYQLQLIIKKVGIYLIAHLMLVTSVYLNTYVRVSENTHTPTPISS